MQMDHLKKTISYLRVKGFKITVVRTAILELLHNKTTPISAYDILFALKQTQLEPNEQSSLISNVHRIPNKTTIYRELDFLLEQGIIREVDFGEGSKRYELRSENHHHHLICLNCKKIEDIDLDQDLTKEEKKIEQQKNFKIVNHSLEFFGLCLNCQ